MEPNHAEGPRSRQPHDWRDARGLVIEGEARVISRNGGPARASEPPAPTPRWGGALDAAALIAPLSPRLGRLALPAGLALVALAAFALSPAERHGAAASASPIAATVAVR